jgi:hypothetical protein
MPAPANTWAVRPDIVTRRIGDTLVIVSLPNNKIFELNRTGARIWELVAEGLDDQQVARSLAEEFDVTFDVARQEMIALRGQLLEEGLIEAADAR